MFDERSERVQLVLPDFIGSFHTEVEGLKIINALIIKACSFLSSSQIRGAFNSIYRTEGDFFASVAALLDNPSSQDVIQNSGGILTPPAQPLHLA